VKKLTNARPAKDGQPWTRQELILAFDLYCRIPFQRTKATDPRVKELSAILQRTPASLARKLGNFGAFDPQLAAQNISGLTHGSKLDRTVWDEFHSDWNGLIEMAQRIRAELEPESRQHVPQVFPTGPSERIVTAKQRLHQAFFRDAVISSYNTRCCVTGLPIPECLVAGRIIPWGVDERRRADPTNGLCMSATFDRLFDCGLITINDNLAICVSSRLLATKDRSVADTINARHGQPIIPPLRFRPDVDCLKWHRKNRFRTA
jgi:putative restriction endonuclease